MPSPLEFGQYLRGLFSFIFLFLLRRKRDFFSLHWSDYFYSVTVHFCQFDFQDFCGCFRLFFCRFCRLFRFSVFQGFFLLFFYFFLLFWGFLPSQKLPKCKREKESGKQRKSQTVKGLKRFLLIVDNFFILPDFVSQNGRFEQIKANFAKQL